MRRAIPEAGPRPLRLAGAALALALAFPSAAEPPSPPPPAEVASAPEPWWLLSAQVTSFAFYLPPFQSPYSNPEMSFGPGPSAGWSFVASVFAGARLWEGAVLAVVPEYSNGQGAPNVSGVAGYPDGNMIRVAKVGTAPYLARAFLQQDFEVGIGAREDEEEGPPEFRLLPGGPFALRHTRPASRLSLTLGKFASSDFFDAADISSDPRHRFMNWAVMTQGAWDFAADTRGYTWGLEVALETPRWAVRAAGALMPTTANGPVLDGNLANSGSLMAEGEYRWKTVSGPGSAKLLGYVNRANMGNYADAIAAAPPGAAPVIGSVARPGAAKYGVGLLVQQEFGPLGAFFRAGWNDGKTETFCFTEIDRSLSVAAALDGAPWGRPGDVVALGVAASGLSASHAAYLAAGGTGFQLGDGALSYAWEVAPEAYYTLRIVKWVELTADVQAFWNPGMNAARGPVILAGLRIHGHI
jgi:high affinity Mn2+ porin